MFVWQERPFSIARWGRLRRLMVLGGWIVMASLLMAGNCGRIVSQVGGPCSFDSECEVGLRCIERVCARGNGEGKPCQAQADCPSPLRCTQGRCVGDVGENCQSPTDCQSGQLCVQQRCIQPIGEGGACGSSEFCQPPLVCSAAQVCTPQGGPGTKGESQSCSKTEDCQSGLSCHPTESVCRPLGTEGIPCAKAEDCTADFRCSHQGSCAKPGDPGTTPEGEACTRTDACMLGLTCGRDGKCKSAGSIPEGEKCAFDENCQAGLVCGLKQGTETTEGVCAKPGEPGTRQAGDACEGLRDCALGLLCGLGKTCETLKPFTGIACENPADTPGPFRVFFEVPRKDTPVKEFYRLPFPNDIRRRDDGTIDLSGHLAPDAENPEGLVQKHFQAIESEIKGFGVNQVVLMRFSKPLEFPSLQLRGPSPTVIYVDLDDGARQGVDISSFPGRGRYICDNYMTVRPFNQTLAHGKTFAVIINKGLTSQDGKPIEPDTDFAAMLKDEVPSDADLAKAHARYKKLRDYLNNNAKLKRFPGPDDVVAAAVFTTQDPDEHFEKFREVARAEPAPMLKDVTLCDGNNTSPCADAEDPRRSCGQPSPLFHEIHARISLPIFQQGTAPYEKTGGHIEYEADGTPKIVRREDVCVAITIPKQTMPQGGWPVVMYAHGTGGMYRAPLTNKIAETLSKIDRDGKSVHFATISIDQVLHGPRRGDSKKEAQLLFFNIENPQSSRNNPVQSAADHFTIVRLLETLRWEQGQSPTQEEVSFNADQIGFLGHSQGGVIAPGFLAYEPGVKIAALSGAGGYLIDSLLNKTSPVNVAGGMKVLLQDNALNRAHPILNLMQMYYERADGLNTAHLLVRRPVDEASAKHILQIYGDGDTFTPPPTMDALAFGLGVTQINPVISKIPRVSDNAVDGPIKGNVERGARKLTAVVAQYKNDNGDGHFALFQHPTASSEMAQFFASWLLDAEQVPTFSR